jgi:lipopolysaccharide transport system ATP-binding protein
MSDFAISVSNVSKCYRVFENQRLRLLHAVWPAHTKGMQEVWALKDINFEIKRGEAVAIIGRNGGGKSTLLEILTGTLAPTTGCVQVNGRVSALLELGSGFNPEYSGRDNVVLNGLLLGLSKDDILSRFGEIEAFAEIGAAIDRPVKTYSSGMMMRLAFAVQVMCDPDILIIDEALSVGDFFFQQKCLSYIRGLRAKGVTLLFVSHDMSSVREVCNRGIFLRIGRIDYDGDNLGAIRHYLQSNDNISINDRLPEKLLTENLADAVAHKSQISDPLRAIKTSGDTYLVGKTAYIISVAFFDEDGKPATSAQMGSFIKIRVQYKLVSIEKVHVHLVVKNRYDQILTSTGSYNLNVSPPLLSANQEAVFELGIQLSMEAGEYVISASLAIPGAGGVGGELVDETPWLGPFHVLWDYNKQVPPFFGLAGMSCNGRFLIQN